MRSLLLRILQPGGEFFQRDRSGFAGGLLLPGLFAPGVEGVRLDPAGLDPGEALLVLPAVDLKHPVAALALGPNVDGPDLLAGAALAVTDAVAVLRAAVAGDGELASAIFCAPKGNESRFSTISLLSNGRKVNGDLSAADRKRGAIEGIQLQTL